MIRHDIKYIHKPRFARRGLNLFGSHPLYHFSELIELRQKDLKVRFNRRVVHIGHQCSNKRLDSKPEVQESLCTATRVWEDFRAICVLEGRIEGCLSHRVH